MGDFKLIVFDMDGTLVKRPSSWEKIHEYFGTRKIEEESWKLYDEGKISYEEFMRRDIAAWGRVHINEIRRIVLNYEFLDGAFELANFLSEKGLYRVIITAGLDILARDVAEKLGFNEYHANGLEYDDYGYLTGRGIMRVEPFKKDKVLRGILNKRGLKFKDVIAVGDSYYDYSLFKLVGLSIGIKSEELKGLKVDYEAEDLYDVVNILRRVL